MAIVRPTPKATEHTGHNKFAGICEVGIVNFTDKSGDYDRADIYIEIEFALKDVVHKHFFIQKELFSKYKTSLIPIDGT